MARSEFGLARDLDLQLRIPRWGFFGDSDVSNRVPILTNACACGGKYEFRV
jgi:hypothetical protein